jgi:hypothetical protein
MTDNRFENLSLLAREKHGNAIADPTDTIPHVGVLGRVEQVCKTGHSEDEVERTAS